MDFCCNHIRNYTTYYFTIIHKIEISFYITPPSPMPTPRPAARPSLAFLELRDHPAYMLPPRLIFLDRYYPADPLIARQRCDVFPGRPRSSDPHESGAHIGWRGMHYAVGEFVASHAIIIPDLHSPLLQIHIQELHRLTPGIHRLFWRIVHPRRIGEGVPHAGIDVDFVCDIESLE